ncbi:MAG: 3-methyl-2-oxobutanoate hydroxymethyltransferase [Hyphomicrobiales bacterium]
MAAGKFTARDMQARKDAGEKFTMLSIYDYPTALIADAAGLDSILVGDSLAMTVLGHEDTISVTVEEMLHHVKAVARAAKSAMVVADMPFMSYQSSKRDAILNAGRFMKEGRADAVKLEGGAPVAPILGAVHRAGIPVMGHIGLTPQSAGQLGGLKVQGKDVAAARGLIDDAVLLEQMGAFAVIMECVPAEVAKLVTARLSVPTISYGAGPHCDGQGMVSADMLGMFDRFMPKFAKQYVDLGAEIRKAFESYRDEVLKGEFPGEDHSYHMNADELARLAGEDRET